MSIRVSIIVYKGDPVDLQKTRHTAILITFSDNSTTLFHATGAAGFFSVEFKAGAQPRSSRTFVQEIAVDSVTGVTKAQIQTVLINTPVNNTSREWNCQNWVGEALTQLVNSGWITKDRRTSAFSAMIDTIMEAEDEE